MRTECGQRIALAAVLLLAAGLRLYALGDVPAGLYCDEAGNGYNAYALAAGAQSTTATTPAMAVRNRCMRWSPLTTAREDFRTQS